MASEMQRQIGANNVLPTTDLAAAPPFHRLQFKPPDSDKHVDGTHKAPGGRRRFSRSGDAISKWNSILPAHSVPKLLFGAGPTSSAQRR
ncbi:hypothetical protein MTX26_35995 (plasmid) [Bradyrhizobium sp. ISRA443]|uniref:hypothetical protein n=1 Tax=unclassified Bradyrhizobium TaxID=2631580 RepID=UPI0024786A32|nr:MULTISPECIES: hypothetical protein [unclassified Bradyrhizobium]WGR90825.1 hypothetical protein MTX20_00415 [Bradyrhizobium sp. ISRA435]WGS03044.1 hypothetical protein MTX23_36060 [Bradyrhizobium sp. ISRA436]WGS09922.1 hypothetical protein MTX18_35990 [Bradyrhizobium sp. ISRA437]WGS16807.1 hypothetical protein MTX26_35995 [Bradyrhizobium sp. ISRA443]